MTIQAVFFDMGGTVERLFFDDHLRLEATGQLRQQLLDRGLDPGLSDEDLYQHIKAGLLRYMDWKEKSLVELESARILQEYIFADLNLPQEQLTDSAEELMFFMESKFYKREMRPEVPDVLKAIKKMGLKIGCISNVMSRNLILSVLQRYGIRGYFNPVILSSVYGRRKPDPSIFQHAARCAEVPPGACIHVGDTISRDVLGAQQAGYRMAVQISHPSLLHQDNGKATPDVVLQNMTELLDVLDKEMATTPGQQMVSAPHKKRVKALLFDAGDALYYRPYKGRRLASFLSGLGLGLPLMPWQDKETLRPMAFTGELSKQAYQDRMLNFYGVHGKEKLAQGRRILEEESQDVTFFAGVPETLWTLKEQGFLLGVITDTIHPTSVKKKWFQQVGIDQVWDVFVSSCEVGVKKPDARIYRRALSELGIEPSEAAFVGHKASELQGAKDEGLITAAFNYDKKALDVKTDFYITYFKDLLDIFDCAQ